VATASVMDKPEVIAAFEREYAAAVDWMLANPEEAGKLVEIQLPQLGLKAAVMTASMKGITWKYTPAAEARADLEAFFTALTELSPQVIGGKLPDDGFYYTE
jgi:NitT/TauT family transport system substrate-binding protein